MLTNIRIDQADGLRRLLAQSNETRYSSTGVSVLRQTESRNTNSIPVESHQAEIIMVVAGKSGVGCTSTTLNLAAAMARLGKEVMVLDENCAANNFPHRQGKSSKNDLLDVVQERCVLSQAVHNTQGFSVLHAARAMSNFSTLNPIEQQRLNDTLIEVSDGMDVLLIDAALPNLSRSSGQERYSGGGIEGLVGQIAVTSSLASKAVLLIVADATASGITESYSLIKRLSLENVRLHLGIMMNKASDEQTAQVAFGNMERVARRNLATRLEYFGCVPVDHSLNRATQSGGSVVESFPAAASARSYFGMARKLCRGRKIKQHIGELSFVVN